LGRLYIERETKRSREAATLYRVLEVLEYVEEELGCSGPHVRGMPGSGGELEVYVIHCSEREGYIKSALKDLEALTGLRVVLKRSPGYGKGVGDIYRELGGLVEEDMLDLLKPLALETARRGGVEYMGILTKEGLWILLEGERHRVRAPWLEESIAIAHTHPPGSCIPSRPDLESCLELLSSGGVLCGIVSVGCSFTLHLVSPLPLECYEHLMRVINRYYDMVEEARSPGEVIEMIRGGCTAVRARLGYT